MVAGIKASPQPPKPGRAIFWFEDWATQGDWCQRYGQRFAVLCAANAPIGNMRYFFDTRSDEDTYLYSVGGTMGPHKKDNDLLRHWVHWVNKPDNRNVLYCPTDATRTEAEWDDHGEVYSRTFDGPDVWAIARVPEGTQTISLYFFNPNGREKNNGQRDYLIEVRSWKSRLPAAVITRVRSPDKYGLPEDCREQELKDVLKAPVQARCRVTDFAGGGVYKTFIVEGPGTFYIRVCRNYSMNTILNGVFLSRYLEPSYKPFSCLATAGGYPEPPDLRNFTPESLAGPHMDLWTRAFVHGSDSRSSIHKTRPLLLYAYRAAAHHPAVSPSLLKNWRWHLKLWTPEDKEHFASFMYRSWSRKQDLYSFYRSREWCPNSPDVIDFTMDEVDILESQKINWRQFIPNSPDYLESNFRAMKQQVRQWSAEFKLKKQKKKKTNPNYKYMNIKRLSNLFLACSVILAGASGFTSGSDETRNGKIKVAPKEDSMAVCEINGDKYAVFEPEEAGGFTSEAEFEVTIEKKPEPHEEFIINEDKTEYKWESSTGLAVDKDGAKEKTCKISAKGKTQWGKEHSVKCTVTFYEKPDPQYKNNKGEEKKLVDLEEEHKAVTPLLLIKEISFNHDTKSGTKDALNLKKEFADAQPIQSPEYKADDQGNVTKNEPFLYIAGTAPTIKVALSVKPDLLKKGKAKTKPEEGTLPVDNLLGELKEQSFDLSASSKEETEFTLDQPVDDAIAKAPQNWTWRLTSLEDKALKTENITCTTKSKDSYIILDIPLDNPWDQYIVKKQPWCQVLDFIINDCSAKGLSKNNITQILNNITTTLFQNVPFSYDTISGSSSYATTSNEIQLDSYIRDIRNGKKAKTNCYAQNNALTALGRLSGIQVHSIFHDRFGQLHPIYLVGISGKINNPFYQSFHCYPSLRGMPYVPIIHLDFRNRTPFGNHVYSEIYSFVYDACGGPTFNTFRSLYFNNTIERSLPNSSAGTIHIDIK